MATSTYLSNPVVTVNAVALTGFATSAVLTRTVESIDTTAFGQTSREFSGGLQNNEITMSLFMTYGASEVYATLKSLVGTRTTVTLKASSAATSATNPLHTVTAAYLEVLPVIQTTVGEISQIDITFTGGVYAETTTP
jgi:hypothetical protein